MCDDKTQNCSLSYSNQTEAYLSDSSVVPILPITSHAWIQAEEEEGAMQTEQRDGRKEKQKWKNTKERRHLITGKRWINTKENLLSIKLNIKDTISVLQHVQYDERMQWQLCELNQDKNIKWFLCSCFKLPRTRDWKQWLWGSVILEVMYGTLGLPGIADSHFLLTTFHSLFENLLGKTAFKIIHVSH